MLDATSSATWDLFVKAGFKTENWKEILCDLKVCDASETLSCCEDGDRECL